MEKDPTPATASRRRPWFWILLLVAAGFVATGGWVAWKGPSAALRWAVSAFDPALRLKLGASFYRDGEWVLQRVRLELRGSREPLFEAREVRLGPGANWRSGRFGSLRLVEPFLRLDPNAVTHFLAVPAGGGSGSSVPWEIAEIAIERGQLWVENFGASGLDISAGIDGTLEAFGPSRAEEEHRLLVYNFYLACRGEGGTLPVMGAGSSEVGFTLSGLSSGRVAGLRIEQGWMIAGQGLERLIAENGADDAASPAAAVILDALDLVDLQVQPDGLPGGLPAVSLRVNTALRDVPLGSVPEELGKTEHHVEFSDIELLSPTDPLRRAVTIRSAFVIFTLAGLANRDLEEVKLLGPTVYVGEPLFEYMQTADQPETAPPQVRESEGWNVETLEVNFGRVVLAVGGRSQLGLPLAFHTTARNLSLSSLAGLNVELALKVPEEDYNFPAYDLSFGKVRGELLFNYPPDVLRNNLVNVVKFGRARWRNFHARDLWVSVTFDREGINGDFGGSAYRGYVNGGFAFFFQPDSPWTGWITGQAVDLASLTADGAPHHVTMDGLADFKIEANGRAAVVDRVGGEMRGRGKGRLVINKLNDLLEALPPEWSRLKSEVTRVSLETLRDFDYTEAKSDFWFVGRQGIIDIRMKGPAGSRNLEMVFHGAAPGAKSAWQQGGRR